MQVKNRKIQLGKRGIAVILTLLIMSLVIPQLSSADYEADNKAEIKATQNADNGTTADEENYEDDALADSDAVTEALPANPENESEIDLASDDASKDVDLSDTPTTDRQEDEAKKVTNNAVNAIGPQADPGYTSVVVDGYMTAIFNTNANGKEFEINEDGGNYYKRIIVQTGVNTTLKIFNMNISSNVAGVSPIALEGTATVNLVLNGTNTINQTVTAKDYSKINAALSVPANAKIIISGTGSLTLKGGYGSAGIGGGENGGLGTIHITGGIINATGGDDSAGIGGGARDNSSVAGNIIIDGSANVTAKGHNWGAGIGGGYGRYRGNITIGGSAEVNATGGREGAGLGGGYKDYDGIITINGGNVVAKGDYTGAGIGGGREDVGNEIIIINDGNVTATGSTFGAAIGGGYKSAAASITINGGDIAAIAGNYGAGIGGGASSSAGVINITDGTITAYGKDGAAIGSGEEGSGGVIDISHIATLRAYSRSTAKTAIDITCNINENSYGDAYFVNAYFDEAISATDDATLRVYDFYSGNATSGEDFLLPASYPCFAYSTGKTESQNDWIAAYLGNDFVGVTVPYYATGNSGDTNGDNSTTSLPSANTANAIRVKRVEFSLGNPAVTYVNRNEIGEDAATFSFPAYNYLGLPEALYTQGGFRYGIESPTLVVDPNWTTRPAGVKTQIAEGLRANTLYFMDTYFSTALTDVSSVYSNSVRFTTLPKILSGSAITGTDAKRPLIDAAFLKNTDNNAPITGATIYWSEETLDYDDISAITTTTGNEPKSIALTDAQYNDDGITGDGYMISETDMLEGGKTYNFLIVVDNTAESASGIQGGGKSALLLAPYKVPADVTTLTLSNTISGAYMDKEKAFNFEISFRDSATATALTEGTFNYTGDVVAGSEATAPQSGSFTLSPENGGKVSIRLKHGQSITIEGVTVDLDVKIEQEKAPNYTVSFNDSVDGASGSGENSTGFKSMSAARSVSFANKHNSVVPAGIDVNNVGVLLLIPSAALALLIIFYAIRQIYFCHTGGK
jgi:hypothetical protein